MAITAAAPTIDETDTDTLTDVDNLFDSIVGRKREEDDDSEKDRFSHYVTKDDIFEATVNGKTVKALCGKTWVPKKSPEKYPVCKTCQEILDALPNQN